MNEESIARARVAGGNDDWLAVNGKADMTDEAFVENLIDRPASERAALGQTPECGAGGLGKFFHSVLAVSICLENSLGRDREQARTRRDRKSPRPLDDQLSTRVACLC